MTDTLPISVRLQDLAEAPALSLNDKLPVGQGESRLRGASLNTLVTFLREHLSDIFADGADGRSAEMRVSGGKVQWRQVGTVTWIDLFSFTDVQGPKGDKGDAFQVNAIGVISERGQYNDQPENFSFFATDEGLLYFREGISGWSTGIPFGKGDPGAQGAPGVDGDDGREVQLQKTATHIQWRLGNTGSFTNLVALADLKGSDASVTQANVTAALTDKAAFLTALGLGNAATRSVGTTAGTVAAGDDGRITGAVQKSANLGDLADRVAARANLGLGSAATLSVGTAVGTVMAADDERAIGVSDLEALRALSPGASVAIDRAFVSCRSSAGDGYDGTFIWVSGDQSANVSADPLRGVWVPPSAQPTGASGAWRRLYDFRLRVEWFGARPYSESAWKAASGAVIDSSSAFQAALNFAGHGGGGEVLALGQFYLINNLGLRTPPGVFLIGSGHGMWSPSFLTEPKTWDGTNLVFGGADSNPIQIPGVTSMKTAGGWRTDPDNPARVFKLNSLMNANAAGSAPATPKALRVAIANRDPQEPCGVRDMRVVPWIGADGISDYESHDTASTDLGDAWDVGVLLNDAEQGLYENLQIRGYWREYGLLEVSAGQARWGRSEGNVIRRVSAQGFCGFGVRSGDVSKVLSTTTNSVTIRWSDESYWPSSGRLELLGLGFTTYSGVSRAGDELTLTGIPIDPTGATQVRNGYRGTGFSTGLLDSVEGWALWHHSGKKAEELGLGIAKGAEFSGFPLRGLHGLNCSFFGEDGDSINTFFHDCDDMVLVGGKFEIGHMVASPNAAIALGGNSLAVAAQGETLNLRLGSYVSSSTRRDLFTPRSGQFDQIQFNPPDRLNSNFLFEAMSWQDIIHRLASGKLHQIMRSDGVTPVAIFRDTGNVDLRGQVNFGPIGGNAFINWQSGSGVFFREGLTARLEIQSTGHILPGADATQNFGSPSKRVKEYFGSLGAINTSDAREKTPVRPLSGGEIAAAQTLASEIGAYRFLNAVAEKGEDAREHVGMTVQRAIEIMEMHGLDPFAYGFICYDTWPESSEPAEFDEDGAEVRPEVVQPAGDRYSFRHDQLCLFIARGQEERVRAAEARMAAAGI